MMATVRTAPGAWIKVPVPTGSWPVTMRVGDGIEAPAFISNERGRRDSIVTYAQVRCPDLRPGRYAVRVTTGEGVTEAQLTIT